MTALRLAEILILGIGIAAEILCFITWRILDRVEKTLREYQGSQREYRQSLEKFSGELKAIIETNPQAITSPPDSTRTIQ